MFLRNRLSGRTSRGQALVETALILPLIVLLLLLAIDLGRVFFTSIDLRNAAHEATMLGGSTENATCAEMKVTVDVQMGRTGDPNAAVCGALDVGNRRRLHHRYGCERIDPGPACDPWAPNYPADSDLRYHVQPRVPIPAGRPLRRVPDRQRHGRQPPDPASRTARPSSIGYEGS